MQGRNLFSRIVSASLVRRVTFGAFMGLLFGCVSSAPRSFANITPDRKGHEYGPSIVLENGKFYTFYCASPVPEGPPRAWDSIRLIISKDGINWKRASNSTAALLPGGRYAASSVCDPSVVKLRGVYYMYHTCINEDNPPDGYRNNRICVALADAIEGPYHRYDVPIIQDLSCPSDKNAAYCVGQPSAVVRDGQIYLFYTNHHPEDPGPGAGKIYLATSTDGIHFTPPLGGTAVWNHRNVDVKLERSTGNFVLVQGEVDTAILPWSYSKDGITWTAYDAQNTIAANPNLPTGGSNHNPGIMADARGSFDGMTFVMYGSSYADGWGKWRLFRSDAIAAPKDNDCSTCVANSCDFGCSRALNRTAEGHCAVPRSTDATRCCVCSLPQPEPDCSQCAAGCVKACRGNGSQVGVCAMPGSTNHAACCSCF